MTNPLVVATDGSALNNPKGPAGWAWYVDKNNWAYGRIAQASNQAAEIVAIYKALHTLPDNVPLMILTDSQFWISVLGEDGRGGWRADWKRRGWVKKDGKVPANLTLLKTVDELILKRRAPLSLVWVKGHSTNRMNIIVDGLCTKASAAQKNNLTLPKSPGWTGKLAPQGEHSTPMSTPMTKATSTVKRATPPSASSPAAAPKRAPVKRPVMKKPKKVVRRDIITSFDDYDDDSLTVTVKKVLPEPEKVYCDSCGGPIDFYGNCRCFKS